MRRGIGSDYYDDGDEEVEIECVILRRTSDGILIKTLDEKEIWLPSKFVHQGGHTDEGMITIPQWLAMDRGLI